MVLLSVQKKGLTPYVAIQFATWFNRMILQLVAAVV